MPSYNFQDWKAQKVESGESRQTIRLERKTPGANAQPGKPIQLYTRMRFPDCRKLVDPDPVCRSVDRIRISDCVCVNGRPLRYSQACAIAKADGFEGLAAMIEWFRKTHGLPFQGLLIRW